MQASTRRILTTIESMVGTRMKRNRSSFSLVVQQYLSSYIILMITHSKTNTAGRPETRTSFASVCAACVIRRVNSYTRSLLRFWAVNRCFVFLCGESRRFLLLLKTVGMSQRAADLYARVFERDFYQRKFDLTLLFFQPLMSKSHIEEFD